MEKQCRLCGELKPIEDFYPVAGMRDGHRNECKPCNLAARKLKYDSAAAVARAREWQRRNPEKVRAYQDEYRARPGFKRAQRDRYYRRNFGISADDVDALLESQGGVCAICGERPERDASLHVDHDHETGKVRGVLCVNCNHGLGKFAEDPVRLRRAVAYLEAR